MLLAALACAVSIVLSVSYQISDTDLWQLLVVGKAIWTRHAIPTSDEWTWVSYGDPQVTSSWGFRAMIWPLWSGFGVVGLFLYRWTATLAAFGLAWLAARRMGARGFVPFVIVAWGALLFRQRAEVRPETLSAVLLALEILILEMWRNGGRDRRPWLVAIALVWANIHISWWLGLAVIGVYALDAVLGPRRVALAGASALPPDRLPTAPAPTAAGVAPPTRMQHLRSFALLSAACAVISLVNPFGWRALIQPFEFALRWRNEPMFRNVVELFPVNWHAHVTDGLPLMVALWPLLLIARWRRSGHDVAGIVMCVAFTYLGIRSQRFLGFYALVAAPFVARDLSSVLESLRWPAWSRGSWARGLLAAAACLVLGVFEWSRPDLPLRVAFDRSLFPAAAADFMEQHGVRGRIFNHFHLGGYLAWRAWPGRERLPFVTTQPENIRPAIRARYPRVFVDRAAWNALDGEYRFDIAVLDRDQDPGDRLLDYLDADTTWALVFSDDAAQLLVRRRGALAAVAQRFGYRILPAGIRSRMEVVPAAAQDTALRSAARAELERMAASSTENGSAHHMLGILAMMDGRLAEARDHLSRALEKKQFLPKVHELLGVVALQQGKAREALGEFERERTLHGRPEGIEVRIGAAHEALGNPAAARRAYSRELRAHPGNVEAAAALARLGQ